MKIAVVSAHTGSLIWFRLNMMKDFIANGCEVVAVGPDESSKATRTLDEAGIQYEQLSVERNGINPLSDLRYLAALMRFMKNERPDKVFVYQAKPVVYGTLAARLAGIDEVYALVAGLGSVFRGQSTKSRLIKAVMTAQYWVAGRCSKIMFFQNRDDRAEFIRRHLIPETKTSMINGSGVDLERFVVAPLPIEPSLLFIGRLIKDKGIREYLAACREIKQRHPATRCMLVGPFDSNPSAMTSEEFQPYIDEGIVEFFGEQDDVRPFIEMSSVYVLPSYHEGTPKTVLEAMAVGRPIVTTDTPGCRETVTEGLNGYLVPPRDTHALVDAIDRVIANPTDAQRMAHESRRIAEAKFDVKVVNRTIMQAMEVLAPATEVQ